MTFAQRISNQKEYLREANPLFLISIPISFKGDGDTGDEVDKNPPDYAKMR
jgi:hypothetical protein|tara:strand:- start:233 stop:385 length:153 start_codon:yes stop_codon:yes gene_type:complete